MSQIDPELTRLNRRIADLELRVAEQKTGVMCEGGKVFGSAEVLDLMEQTLESWRQRKRALQDERGREREE